MTRFAIAEFNLANPLYIGATVNFYTVSATGAKTTTLATLYDAPAGTGTLANPQILDSAGKIEQPVYIDGPVIADISELSIADHSTGIIWGGMRWKGAWVTDTAYVPNDIVVADDASNDWYIVTAFHESDVFATDVSAGYLEKATDVSVLAALFDLPDPSGNGLKFPRVNTGGTAYELLAAAAMRTAMGLDIGIDVLAPTGDGANLTNVAKLAVAQSFTKAQRGADVPLTSASAHIAIDASAGNFFSHTFTENTTLDNPTNLPAAGQEIVVRFTQHASSPKTLAFGSYWDFEGGTAPSVTASNSARDTLVGVVRDATHIEAKLLKNWS
jgi:hypothetical protein